MAKINMGPICAVEETRDAGPPERFGRVRVPRLCQEKKRTEGGPRGEGAV